MQSPRRAFESGMTQLLYPDTDLRDIDVVAISQKPSAAAELIWAYFDPAYYVRRYADINLTQVDPAVHYCTYGWREGRDPSATFCTRQYLEARPDVAALGVNPLLHWALFGRHEPQAASGGQTHLPTSKQLQRDMAVIAGRFDARFYRKSYPELDRPGINPIEHFCLIGWRERRNPAAWFSTALYLAHHPDVAGGGINPFVHYIRSGEQERRRVFPAEGRLPRVLVTDSSATLVSAPDLRDLLRYVPAADGRVHGRFDPTRLQVHWVVPPIQIDSVVHLNIFRMVHLLELCGHECFVWLDGGASQGSAADYYDVIVKHFSSIRAAVSFVADGFAHAGGDIVFATAWQTVAKVRAATGFRERAYFVQDFEPAGVSGGADSLAIEATYQQDLACICAGPWLAAKLADEYGSWARHFHHAHDEAVYLPPSAAPASNDVARIAVHVGSPRRGIELVFLALERLAAEGVALQVAFFGADFDATRAPFAATMHGELDGPARARLYRNCDLGICFSTERVASMPQDMMACGLPVLDLDCRSTRATFPAGTITLSRGGPIAIAQDIKALLADASRRARQADCAASWVRDFSWEKSGRMVEAALIERLIERGHPRKPEPSSSLHRKVAPHASVCIPTCNGGATLLRLLDAVRSQSSPWPFEIVVVDSSSDDGTAEQMAAMPDVVFHTIAREDFGPGRTRNLCAGLASGRMIAFLTQDAMPADRLWLFNIVSVLEHFPDAAGAFGRLAPAEYANPFTARDFEQEHAATLAHPLAISRENGADPDGRRMLHAFSSRNCCLRRSAWERTQFPDVSYGEDQLWAAGIIEAGGRKIFVPTATVRHSREYSPAETRRRAAARALFLQRNFGESLLDNAMALADQLQRLNERDRQWATAEEFGAETLARRYAQNEARLLGYTDAALMDGIAPPPVSLAAMF
jgi:glycosyltransferase involved in cell wall biosynthesis